MSKNEWIWVAIRIFGIYLLVLAIVAIPEAIGAVYAHLHLAQSAGSSSCIESMADSMRKAAVAKGVTAFFQFFLFLIASYYFIRYGKFLHRLASREKV